MATEGQQQVQIGDGSLKIGDRVVYPNQGICRITGVETKEIAGRNWEVVTLSREEDGATVMVPRAKVMGIGLRKVASVGDVEKVFDYFASPGDDPQLDWKVRHRENADRMTGGGLFGTVEVLKGLHALSRVRPLPQKERELYDSARHQLVGEISAALGIPMATAEDNLDYALWPPPGMTHKGKALEPATIGMALKPRAAAGDDDDELGFDDDESKEKSEDAKEEKEGTEAANDEDEEEGAEKKPKAGARPKPPKAPKAAKPAPSIHLAPAPKAGPPRPAPEPHHRSLVANVAAIAGHKLKEAVLQAAHKAKEAVVHAAEKAKPPQQPAPLHHAPAKKAAPPPPPPAAHAPAHKTEKKAAKPAHKPAAKVEKPAAKKAAPKAPAKKPAAKAKPASKPAAKSKGKK